MSTTFEQLGVPFSLSEATTEEACEFVGRKQCSLCRRQGQNCFRLDIGCAVIIPCSKCGSLNGLDADDREDISCRSCGTPTPFPKDEEIVVCYDCLRLRRSSFAPTHHRAYAARGVVRRSLRHAVGLFISAKGVRRELGAFAWLYLDLRRILCILSCGICPLLCSSSCPQQRPGPAWTTPNPSPRSRAKSK